MRHKKLHTTRAHNQFMCNSLGRIFDILLQGSMQQTKLTKLAIHQFSVQAMHSQQ